MNSELFKTAIIWVNFKLRERHLNLKLSILSIIINNESGTLRDKFGVDAEVFIEELGEVFLLLANYKYPINLINIVLIQKSLK